jgi:alpha-L-fucosidase
MKAGTFSVIVVLFAWVSFSTAAPKPPTGPLLNDPARSEAFMDWGLGLFIHWSIDAQLGSVISHSMVGASEVYLDRYINELPASFNPDRYDPDKWMQLAKLAGIRYAVLTTKHHNGFCLWDTETTDFDIMNTPYQKDIVRQFADACRKYGIKVGFYFSPEDFYFLRKQGHLIRRRGVPYVNISENAELLAYDKAQMKELLTRYGPIDVVFLDSSDAQPMTQYVHQLQPDCLVTRGEMETPEQNIPSGPIPGPWEACFTLGTQWQFKPTNEDYKSGTQLIEMLIEIRAKGGNLLINVGPEPDGVIPFEQERRFRELALWMFVNDEAIHSIRPCPVVCEGDLWFTQSTDQKTVYVFLTKQENWTRGQRKTFAVKSLRATPQTAISVLGHNGRVVEYQPDSNPEPRFTQNGETLEISVVRAQRLYNNSQWPNPVVVKLENAEFVPASY